jgi:hypothetical protein
MMTEEYRVRELKRAEAEVTKARSEFLNAKTTKRRIEAEENLNFWQSKVAYLKAAARETHE